MTIDSKNPHRIRIAYRDEAEHKRIKLIVKENVTRAAQILQEDLFSIRVDSVKRTAVLYDTGKVHVRAVEALSQENDI